MLTNCFTLPRRFSCRFLYKGPFLHHKQCPETWPSPSSLILISMGQVQLLCRVGRSSFASLFFLLLFFSFPSPSTVRKILNSPQPCDIQVLCPNHGVTPQKAAKWKSAMLTGSSRLHLRKGVKSANLRRHYNAVGPTWNLLFSCLQKAWIVWLFLVSWWRSVAVQ